MRKTALFLFAFFFLLHAQERTCEDEECTEFVVEDSENRRLRKNDPVLVQLYFIYGNNSNEAQLAPYFPRVDDYARLDVSNSTQ